MTSRATTAAQRFNGFHWAAVVFLLGLGLAGALASWRDAVVGLNGTLIVGVIALTAYAAAPVFERVAALARPVSASLITVSGVLGASMLVATAVRVGIGWILLAPGIAGVIGLTFGVIRESRRQLERPNRAQRQLEPKQKLPVREPETRMVPLHARISGLIGAVLTGMAVAAAIATPALIGMLTQVAYIGGSFCLGVALFGAGKQLVIGLRGSDPKPPVIVAASGQVLQLFTLYTLAAAAPYTLLTFVIGTLAA